MPTLKEIEDFLYKTYLYKKTNEKDFKFNIDGDLHRNTIKKHQENIDHLKMNMLTNRIPFELDNVLLKSSNTHGRGLFANKNINKGDLITFYPCDILEYYPNNDRYKDGHITGLFPSIEYAKKYGNQKENFLNYYCFEIDLKYAIFGHPSFDTDKNYMGHFINDGAKSNSSEKADKIYSIISLKKANCEFYILKGELHVAIIASKDILEGEELFIHYGIPYWNSYNKNNMK
jgi:SET domain-containing protein